MRKLSSAVVALGFVSLFMDLSSEMIHSVLPVFLVGVMGVSALSVGIIEGVAEATAALSKLFSGVISDRIGRRKPLVLLGYGLAALSKPLFPLAGGPGVVLLARVVDRVGKGIRGAPRDAMIADLTPRALRGAAYGLRQAMDTVGAVAGPAVALVLMTVTHDNFRLVFWIAVIPAVIAVAVIVFAVREPSAASRQTAQPFPIRRREIARLTARYWAVVTVATVLTLARFSEAFLLLRGDSVGLAAAYVPVILIVMNIVYAASAYPLGRLADGREHRWLLAFGIGVLIVADLVLAAATTIWLVMAGAMLWGLHMGATQGLMSAMIADTAPDDHRGTAFGVFNLVTGVAVLIASVLAGALWSAIGPSATFIVGAAFAAAAVIALLAEGAART